MKLKDRIALGINGSELVTNNSKDFFSYLREPTTKAESYLYDALVEKGVLEESDIDAATAHLMIRRWVRKIKNNKKIIEKANLQFNKLLERASQTEREKINFSKADEEWIDYFMDLSSTISNEIIQEIFAHLLLKEHLSHGSITKVMLNSMALLDSKTATAFFALCQLTYSLTIGDEERIIPLVIYDTEMYDIMEKTGMTEEEFDDYFELCPDEKELELLDEIGLVNLAPHSSEYMIYYAEDSQATFKCDGYLETIKGKYDEKEKFYYIFSGYAFYSQVGLSLYKALSKSSFKDLNKILSGFVAIQIDKECFIENDEE